MIIMAGTMTFEPADIPGFTAAVADMIAQIRAEDGCNHYSLLVEDAAAGLINVTEIWRDDAALHAHLAQPWTVSFFARFGPKARTIDLLIYDVSGTRALAL